MKFHKDKKKRISPLKNEDLSFFDALMFSFLLPSAFSADEDLHTDNNLF